MPKKKIHRILNVSRNFRLKFSQACRAVEECSACWVVPGVAIRDLTLKESIAARNEQARLREPLPLAEIPGLITTGIDTAREFALANDANAFFALAGNASKYVN